LPFVLEIPSRASYRLESEEVRGLRLAVGGTNVSDETTEEQAEVEAQTLWQARQEAYRKALQAWRRYPAPTKDDPLAEARDRDGKLRGGDT
jgi:hypothetical protein